MKVNGLVYASDGAALWAAAHIDGSLASQSQSGQCLYWLRKKGRGGPGKSGPKRSAVSAFSQCAWLSASVRRSLCALFRAVYVGHCRHRLVVLTDLRGTAAKRLDAPPVIGRSAGPACPGARNLAKAEFESNPGSHNRCYGEVGQALNSGRRGCHRS